MGEAKRALLLEFGLLCLQKARLLIEEGFRSAGDARVVLGLISRKRRGEGFSADPALASLSLVGLVFAPKQSP